jgi:hypothetical protein
MGTDEMNVPRTGINPEKKTTLESSAIGSMAKNQSPKAVKMVLQSVSALGNF